MIKEEIFISDDAKALSQHFTDFLLQQLNVFPHINISLSGGSTPKALFDYWAENCKESIPWQRISFFWGDERCVPPDNEMSNFGMTRQHLFSKVPALLDASIYRIHGENEPSEESQWYSKVLNKKLQMRNDIPCFEIVMLGLGDDGHTVSIFPDRIDDLWDSNLNCVVAEHPETGMKRVSITGKVVNSAHIVAFLVTGKSKAEKVRDIIKNRAYFAAVYPAARVDPQEGCLYWFLDKEAASLL